MSPRAARRRPLAELVTTVLVGTLMAITASASAPAAHAETGPDGSRREITTPGQTERQYPTLELFPRGQLRDASAAPAPSATAATSCAPWWTSRVMPPPTIRVYRTSLGRVETVGFTTYVRNVLPKEWIPSWRAEALKSGAMAVKTYAWYWTLNRKSISYVVDGQCFDVVDTVGDQVYSPGSATPATDAAVAATWDLRMTVSGKLFQAQYLAGSGTTCGAGATGSLLSQWGSEGCARMGMTVEPILRTYYSGVGFDRPAQAALVSGYGDLTGDGKADIVGYTRAVSGGALRVYPGTGTGRTTTAYTIGSGWNAYTGTLLTDLTGDRRLDLVTRTSAGSLVLHRNVGGGRLATPVPLPGTSGFGAYAQLVAPGDLTGDGRPDIAGVTATGALVVHRGTGTASATSSGLTSGTTVASGWQRFQKVIATGDLTGDRRPDLAGIDTATGNLLLYRGPGRLAGPPYAGVAGRDWGAYTLASGVGDFTGDGRPDVVAVDPAVTSPVAGPLMVYAGTGTSTSPLTFRARYGSGWAQFGGLL